MKGCSLAMLSLLATSSSFAQVPYTQEQVIAYAKSVDVHTLDPSLPSQRLEDWLRSGPPHVEKFYWWVAGTCDLKPDEASVDYPLCAKIRFIRGGEAGEFLVRVGTTKNGVAGRPQLYYGVGTMETENPLVLTGSSEHLSDLPALLDQPAVSSGVQKLYAEIVAHHPSGIPTGTEMAAIRPYLSERLAKQLQMAQACQDDYNRQRATGREASKPRWLGSGLFSGEGAHSSPVNAVVNRKEKRNDGSYLVSVGLGWFAWIVEAHVIPEDGRFVVDDVRIFDRFPAEGPSHLLSDSFSGCDGSRWTGQPSVRQ